MPNSNRRDFLKNLTAVGAGLALGGSPAQAADSAAIPAVPARRGRSVAGLIAPKLETVRWGLIGLGARGLGSLRETLLLEHCAVSALCDNYAPALDAGLAAVAKARRPTPAAYGEGSEAYRRMLERSDIDAVLICTPWREHVRMAVAAMRAGKHAFVEVPASPTLEGCWELVDVAEETQRHCMMLEECCYGRDELMLLRLCREGVFGELVYGEGAYNHDLRYQMSDLEHGTGSWRTLEHINRNGNLYPTHGLGPVAQYMSINRGDKFDTLVSFSSASHGMAEYAARNFPAGHPRRTTTYRCGDINTSLLRTARGRTIMVQHDTMNAQAYSRANVIKGTHGGFAGYPGRIFVEESDQRAKHEWDADLKPWYEKYEHPLWKKVGKIAAKIDHAEKGMGHGGMDFVMRWRLVQCLREGLPLDQDVYDAAAWSAVGPLSELSVAGNGAPVEVPDFTRGAWRETAPLGVVS